MYHRGSDLGNRTAGLMAENHRFANYEISDIPVLEVMDIASTYANMGNRDTDIVRTKMLLDTEITKRYNTLGFQDYS
jgi:hypothetical protein